jgi:hypothetical protein
MTARDAWAVLNDSDDWPYAQDLDNVWHKRPSKDHWSYGADHDGPNCRTLCGQAIHSVHVSDSLPEIRTEIEEEGGSLCTCAMQ